MNKWLGIGRLTRNPDIRYTQGQNGDQMCIARYTLAVDRRFAKKEGNEQTADFISCVAFGKLGEFAEKYLSQGIKIAVTGRIQTGSYTNKDGQKVYTTEVVVEECEFAESKNNSGNGGQPQQNQPQQNNQQQTPAPEDGFMKIPTGIENDLPFK